MAIKPTLYFLFTYNKYHQNVYFCLYLCWCAIGIACPCGCGRSHIYTGAHNKYTHANTFNRKCTAHTVATVEYLVYFSFSLCLFVFVFTTVVDLAVHCFCVCWTFWPSLFLSFSSVRTSIVFHCSIVLTTDMRYKIYG